MPAYVGGAQFTSTFMRQQLRKKRNSKTQYLRVLVVAVVLLILGVLFLVSTFGSRQFGPMHKIAMEFVGPVQKTVTATGSLLSSFKSDYIDSIQNFFKLNEEKKRLSKQLQETEALLNRSREAMATNASLRKLLDFKNAAEQRSIAATIVGKDPSPFFRSVIIDQGANSGIVKGSPVVCSEGVVGQIFTTSPNYSKVLLAIAPSSAIDVLLQKSRVRGILKGTGELTYRLEYILKNVDVEVGDYVVTAGYGGVFPTGLPVGIVSKVFRQPQGMFHEIEVHPAVDYQTIEHLLVIEKPNLNEIFEQPVQP